MVGQWMCFECLMVSRYVDVIVEVTVVLRRSSGI